MSSRQKKIWQRQAKALKLMNFLVFFGLLAAINLIFLYFYYRDASLDFSFFTGFFILFFVLDYVLALNVFGHVILRILLLLLYVAIVVYSLINFVYYEVFGAFLALNFGQAKALNRSLLELLSGYYLMVPPVIYSLALILILLLLAGSTFYIRCNQRINQSFQNLLREINFLNRKNRRPWRGVLAGLMFFLLVNGLFYGSLAVYKQRIAFNRSSRLQYFSDLGIYGHLAEQTAGLISRGFFSRAEKSAAAAPALATAPAAVPLNDWGRLKENLSQISALDSTPAAAVAAVPAFSERPHVIVYQMESAAAWPLQLDPDPMPFLSRLMKENVSVDNFFANSCITVNAEFASLCSFYPESTGPISDIYAYNNYYCLPGLLKDQFGYQTNIYHSNSAQFWNRDVLAPRWGFTQSFFTPFFHPRQDDGSVLSEVVKQMKNAAGPTFNYVIGFTSHGPHDQNFIDFNLKHNNLKITPYAGEIGRIPEETKQSEVTIRNYVGFLSALDEGIARLFSELETNGLLDKTMVVIYGDHRYYNFNQADPVAEFLNYNRIPFVIYLPSHLQSRIQTVASMVDVAPTLLNLIAGEDYQPPQNFVGHSLFAPDFPNFALSKCLGENLFVNRDLILKNDSLLKLSMPLYYFNPNAWPRLETYAGFLSETVKYSDKLVAENQLGRAFDQLADNNRAGNLASKTMTFNQETDIDKDGISNLREQTLGTNPELPDTDGDGFLDGVEVNFGWDPLSSHD